MSSEPRIAGVGMDGDRGDGGSPRGHDVGKLMHHDHAFKVGLLALSAATIIVSLKGIHDQHEAVDCLTQYNQATAARAQITSALGTEQNDAVNDVINGTGTLLQTRPSTPAQAKANGLALRKLFVDFKARTDDIANERKAHPAPTLPKDCR